MSPRPPALATFQAPQGVTGDWSLRRLTGHEALCGVPEYRLLLDGPAQARSAERLLARVASVSIPLADGGRRALHGWIVDAEVGDPPSGAELDHEWHDGEEPGPRPRWRLTLRPWMWLLSLNTGHRVFRNLTAMEIVRAVLAPYAPHALVEERLSRSLRQRPRTVQYGETDLDFVTRLLEDEGLLFWFEHEVNRHRCVIADPDSPADTAPVHRLSWRDTPDAGPTAVDDAVIWAWRRRRQWRAQAVRLIDFAPESPDQPVVAGAARTLDHPSPVPTTHSIHPGRQDDLGMHADATARDAEGERRARDAVRRLAGVADLAGGVTAWRALSCGQSFELLRHPTDAGPQRVVSLVFELTQGGPPLRAPTDPRGGRAVAATLRYAARVTAWPTDLPRLPERHTRWPRMPGPLTARVVGPPGTPLHLDRHGRVRLRFHWEAAAALAETDGGDAADWVRVATPWSGGGFGQVAWPRVGDEVLVDFLDGDPDRPIVIGRLFNGDSPPPYALPTHAGISGWRSRPLADASIAPNELRFEDSGDSPHVWMQSATDWHLRVGRDRQETIQRDVFARVGGNWRQQVDGALAMRAGDEARVEVGGDTHLRQDGDLVWAIAQDCHWRVGDALSVHSGQSLALRSDAGLDIGAAQGLRMSSDLRVDLQAPLAVVLQSDSRISLSAGGSFLTLGPEGVSLSGPLVSINSGGAALSADGAAGPPPSSPVAPTALADDPDPLEGMP